MRRRPTWIRTSGSARTLWYQFEPTPHPEKTMKRSATGMKLTGVVHYEGGSFRIVPRNYGDIVDLGTAGVGPKAPASMSFSVAPNPARHALFSFSLPQAADVIIGIYDVAGRQVKSLVNGKLPSGNYEKSWSGETSDGRTANAGVYFARMKANGVEYSLRTVFLGR